MGSVDMLAKGYKAVVDRGINCNVLMSTVDNNVYV